MRIGVMHPQCAHACVAEGYEAALRRLASAGALLVDVEIPKAEGMREAG